MKISWKSYTGVYYYKHFADLFYVAILSPIIALGEFVSAEDNWQTNYWGSLEFVVGQSQFSLL